MREKEGLLFQVTLFRANVREETLIGKVSEGKGYQKIEIAEKQQKGEKEREENYQYEGTRNFD